MATYAAYRHIELDKVGYSKKRVRNPSSEIFNVLCTPPSAEKQNGHHTPRRSSHNNDSFTRLFGTPNVKKPAPRRGSLTNQDVTNRNPVTGNGVTSWDSKPGNRHGAKVHTERNPVTGETYQIVTPPITPTTTPTKPMKPIQNGHAHTNGTSTPLLNGNHNYLINGNTPNGHA